VAVNFQIPTFQRSVFSKEDTITNSSFQPSDQEKITKTKTNNNQRHKLIDLQNKKFLKRKMSKKLEVIEGIRGFVCLWIIACHTAEFLSFILYVVNYNHSSQLVTDSTILTLFNSIWLKLSVSIGFQVDIFFLISAFLFSLRLFSGSKAFSGSTKSDVLFLYVNRVSRLWPLLVISIFWIVWMQDYNSHNTWTLVYLLLFPLDGKIPITFTVCWSIGVDFFNSILLYFAFSFLSKNKIIEKQNNLKKDPARIAELTRNIHLIGMVLVSLTLIPRILLFVFSSEPFLSYESLFISKDVRSQLRFPQFSAETFSYYINELFPEFLSSLNSSSHKLLPLLVLPDFNTIYIKITFLEGFLFFQRTTPFAVGFYAAMYYHYTSTSKEQMDIVISKKEKKTKLKVVQRILLLLSILILVHPLYYALSPQFKETNIQNLTHLHRPAFTTTNESFFMRDLPVGKGNWSVYQLRCQENWTTEQETNCHLDYYNTTIPIEITEENVVIRNWEDINQNQRNNWTLFYSVMNRPLYSLAFGYLLYNLITYSRTNDDQNWFLLSHCHSFFTFPVFQFLGSLSYGIYLLHTRIVLQWMMKWLPLFSLLEKLSAYNCSEEWKLFTIFVIYFLLTVVVSAVVATINCQIEKPIQSVVQPWVKEKEKDWKTTITGKKSLTKVE
jgi:peptidoglycan/LPS O-acetylase OafA/YrhL